MPAAAVYFHPPIDVDLLNPGHFATIPTQDGKSRPLSPKEVRDYRLYLADARGQSLS